MTPRAELSGSVLAYAKRVEPGDQVCTGGNVCNRDAAYVLKVYDARRDDPEPATIADASHGVYCACIVPTPFATGYVFLRSLPTDFAVHGDRVAFWIDEQAQGQNLNGIDGLGDALGLFDIRKGTVEIVKPASFGFTVRLTDRWLVADSIERDAVDPTTLKFVVDVFDLQSSFKRFFELPCDFPTLDVSDDVIPCGVYESTRGDLNGDGDELDIVLHVFVPAADGGPAFFRTPYAMTGPFDPMVQGPRVFLATDETANGKDINGDGEIGGRTSTGAGPYALVAMDFSTMRTSVYRQLVGGPFDPFLHFIGPDLLLITPDIRRTFFNDADGDGQFPELLASSTPGVPRLGDNCPLTVNPYQTDSDGDGIGDACETRCPAERAAPACFAGVSCAVEDLTAAEGCDARSLRGFQRRLAAVTRDVEHAATTDDVDRAAAFVGEALAHEARQGRIVDRREDTGVFSEPCASAVRGQLSLIRERVLGFGGQLAECAGTGKGK